MAKRSRSAERKWPAWARKEPDVCPVTGGSHAVDARDLYVEYGNREWRVRVECDECGAEAIIEIDPADVDEWEWHLSSTPPSHVDLDDLSE